MKYKVLVWGTGSTAKEVIDNSQNWDVIGFIESYKSANEYHGVPLYTPNNLPVEYDYIVVANSYATEIATLCRKMSLDFDKIVFMIGTKIQQGCTDDNFLKHFLGEKNWTLYCAEYGITDGSFFEDDRKAYTSMNTRSEFEIRDDYLWPVIRDKYAKAGSVSNYFFQDLWAAKLICKSGVKEHFDIGSRLDGFIAHILSMGIPTTMIDVREFPQSIDGLHTIVADAKTMSGIDDNSISSLSALCSLEHFGLGRYGDPIDPDACFICFENIQKKLSSGANLYISVPIGKERLEFNAHRVFYASSIVKAFSSLNLMEYSCTADGRIEEDIDIHTYDTDNHNGNYRYGLFWFKKP